MARKSVPMHTTYGDYLKREATENKRHGRIATVAGAAVTAIGAAVSATTAGVGGMAIMAPGTGMLLHGQGMREQGSRRQAKAKAHEGHMAAVRGKSAALAMHGGRSAKPDVPAGKTRTDPYVDAKGRNYANGRAIKGKV
jgi:hypothetical protein